MKAFWQIWQQYCVLRRQRRQLLAMDARTRKDLAISRVDAEQLAGCYAAMENKEDSEKGKSCKR